MVITLALLVVAGTCFLPAPATADHLADCGDGIDNDSDGRRDYPWDSGCTDPEDPSERGVLVCDDGLDNDADGTPDYPWDNGCADVWDDDERGTCEDGWDNDRDGRTDYPEDPGCSSSTWDQNERGSIVCDDGLDNDEDGRTDYTQDTGCSSVWDADERGSIACDDGLDNDEDGQTDHPADSGCSSIGDTDERGSIACDDGLDNDGDGKADHPADAGCSSIGDTDERGSIACDDGLDNDGDGWRDYPSDPGCSTETDTAENPNPACSDGIDNDGDGETDHPLDPGCSSYADTDEDPNPACSDERDNDGDLLADFPLDPGCSSRTDTNECEPDDCAAHDLDGDGVSSGNEVAGHSNPLDRCPDPCSSTPSSNDDGDCLSNADEKTAAHAAIAAIPNPCLVATSADHVWVHLGFPGSSATVVAPDGRSMTVTHARCLPYVLGQFACLEPLVAKVHFNGSVTVRPAFGDVSVSADDVLVDFSHGSLVGAVVDGTWTVWKATNAAFGPAGFRLVVQGKTIDDVRATSDDIAQGGHGAQACANADALRQSARTWNWHLTSGGAPYDPCQTGASLFDPPQESLHPFHARYAWV